MLSHMDTMTSDKVSIDATQYRRLVDIALAANAFVSNETHTTLEALQDAVLDRTGLID